MKIFIIRMRTLVICAILLLVLGLCVHYGATVSVDSQVRELPIYNVHRDDGVISVTFDCAWNADDIEQIIEVLDANGCPGTFFVVGTWAQKYPEAVKKLYDAGHEIASHSYNHAHYTKLSRPRMLEDMDKTDRVIEGITGTVVKLFRAPSGDYNSEVVRVCRQSGREMLQWDVESLETKMKTHKM